MDSGRNVLKENTWTPTVSCKTLVQAKGLLRFVVREL